MRGGAHRYGVSHKVAGRLSALPRDHVKDRQGNKHDLLVLSHEVAKFESALNAYGVTRAFG